VKLIIFLSLFILSYILSLYFETKIRTYTKEDTSLIDIMAFNLQSLRIIKKFYVETTKITKMQEKQKRILLLASYLFCIAVYVASFSMIFVENW